MSSLSQIHNIKLIFSGSPLTKGLSNNLPSGAIYLNLKLGKYDSSNICSL